MWPPAFSSTSGSCLTLIIAVSDYILHVHHAELWSTSSVDVDIRHAALESVELWKQLIMLLSLSVSRLLHRRTTQECHGCALGGRRVYKKWLKRNRTKASVMFPPCSTVWVRCNIVCFMLWHKLISPLLWCFWQKKKQQRNKKPTSETVTMVVAVIIWQKHFMN